MIISKVICFPMRIANVLEKRVRRYLQWWVTHAAYIAIMWKWLLIKLWFSLFCHVIDAIIYLRLFILPVAVFILHILFVANCYVFRSAQLKCQVYFCLFMPYVSVSQQQHLRCKHKNICIRIFTFYFQIKITPPSMLVCCHCSVNPVAVACNISKYCGHVLLCARLCTIWYSSNQIEGSVLLTYQRTARIALQSGNRICISSMLCTLCLPNLL